MKLKVLGGEIIIPRGLPLYTELYGVISLHAPSPVLRATGGLPAVLRYRSLGGVGEWTLGLFGWIGWLLFVVLSYRTVGSGWAAFAVGVALLSAVQGQYRRSKRYEFYSDRMVARSWMKTTEYSVADLKDVYLDRSESEGAPVVLRLAFENGDSLELHSGSIAVEQLHAVLKEHYSLN